jgi:hypothetical protein
VTGAARLGPLGLCALVLAPAALVLAPAALLLAPAACRRQALPPRPDGAAVVVAASAVSVDGDVKPIPELEPDDTLATAQRLPLTAGAPSGVAGTIHPPAGRKRDVDIYRIDVPAPDGGAPPAPAADGAAAAPPLRRSLRADLRPEAGLGATLEALDDAGKTLVIAGAAEADERVAIPNLAVTPGTYYLRVHGSGDKLGAYRLIVRLAPLEPGGEIEPNGSAALATELAPGGEAVGFLGWRRDQDWYRLPTGGLAEGSVLSVDLDPIPDVAASLTLSDAAERKLVESRGRKAERVALRNVRVPPGDGQVFLMVRADAGANADARYNLRVRAELARAGGGDAEPNDDPAHAQPIGDGTLLGFLGRGDVDVFRIAAPHAELDVEVVPPERVDVKLEILREDGTVALRVDKGRRREAERMPNFYVEGASAFVRLSAGSGDGNPDEPYRLTISSRAPEPGDEREPNDTAAAATPLEVGAHGHGLLAPRGDVDLWKVDTAHGSWGGGVTVTGIRGLRLAVRVLNDAGRALTRVEVPDGQTVAAPVPADESGCCLVEIREATGRGANAGDRYDLVLPTRAEGAGK